MYAYRAGMPCAKLLHGAYGMVGLAYAYFRARGPVTVELRCMTFHGARLRRRRKQARRPLATGFTG